MLEFREDDEIKMPRDSRRAEREYTDDGWGEPVRDLATARPQELLQHDQQETPGADDGWGNAPDDRSSLDDARRAVAEAYEHQGDAPFQAPDVAGPTSDPTTSDASSEHRSLHGAIARSEANDVLSLDEAKEYAENLGVQYVDFNGFDLKTANETNATLESLMDRYPDVKGVRSLSTMQTRDAELAAKGHDMGPISDGTIAETTPPGFGPYQGIFVNEAWARDNDAASTSLEIQAQTNGHPPGLDSMHGVVAHEFGHVVYNDIQQRGDGDHVLTLAQEEYAQGKDSVRDGVSRYATENHRELFAEAFAEYHLSDKPRPVACRIGLAVDKYYEDHDN